MKIIGTLLLVLFISVIVVSPSCADEVDVDEAVYTESAWGLVYPVKNLIEGIYDNDGNGSLVDIEVLYFLRDVMRAARRKGKFQVVSTILSEYDEDRDGWISKDEAKTIEAFLY